ncbi:alpha/beta fold hydrolase [Pseudooctadecabacter jejudonensis]|uniref:Esterase YbfF n=1 Tax=Pseudooctadecabacter jejudonensis TaxID=1391910 RepID=A0A1Y5SM81_9RHOB|nr:alpha/beta fold hydrolase [Pseudooctadecabacter jejudonensis]SLN42841.1 Esterase YbfF [Pseudooctadecabacter jejudonensis]
MLNVVTHGDPKRPTLLIAHGLFGSARNWGVIAKRLSDAYHVVVPDMRNHGASPWYDSHSYADLAEDLREVLAAYSDGPAYVLGHSMGGKSAMVLALQHPEIIEKLMVADIAPVGYAHTQTQHIAAMRAVDLGAVEKRADAGVSFEPEVRDFLLQSLDMKAKCWVLNLDVLEAYMSDIIGFPEVSGTFEGTTVFLSGADSDYVRPEHRHRIKALFPAARFAKIPGAGHWLHAQKPREFEASVRAVFG